MVKVNCLNKISKAGMKLFSDNYEIVDDFAQADAALVEVPQCMIWNFLTAFLP